VIFPTRCFHSFLPCATHPLPLIPLFFWMRSFWSRSGAAAVPSLSGLIRPRMANSFAGFAPYIDAPVPLLRRLLSDRCPGKSLNLPLMSAVLWVDFDEPFSRVRLLPPSLILEGRTRTPSHRSFELVLYPSSRYLRFASPASGPSSSLPFPEPVFCLASALALNSCPPDCCGFRGGRLTPVLPRGPLRLGGRDTPAVLAPRLGCSVHSLRFSPCS